MVSLSSPNLAFAFLAVALVFSAPLITAQTLRSAGNRRLLTDPVVSDYTKWCNGRDSTPTFAGQAAYVFTPFDTVALSVGVDYCNAAVFNVNGQDVKLPATITGTVTETALPDGRRVTVSLQESGVFAPVLGSPPTNTSSAAQFSLMGFNYYGGAGMPPFVTSGFTTAAFFKTLALVQSLTYTLVFELHDKSTPGAPLTVNYNDIFDATTGNVFVSENLSNLVIEGPLRRSPLYPNVPVGNPAVFTINSLSVGTAPSINTVDINILSPDDGSVLNTLKQEFANYPPAYLTTGFFTPNVVASSAPVNGACNPTSGTPNQCFSAAGDASVCCPGQCGASGAKPVCA